MAEKGGPRVTVREVAERAGVQPALVNYYFGSKQGLLQAVVVEVASAGVERIQRATRQSGSARDRVRSLVESWVAGFAEDPYFPRLVAEQVLFGDDEAIAAFVQQFGRPNLAAIAGLLEDGEAQGELRHVESQYFVPALAGMCLWFFLAAPVTQRLFRQPMTPEHVEGFIRATAELVLNGISAQPNDLNDLDEREE
jgi:AcrR family transcriptional regulator